MAKRTMVGCCLALILASGLGLACGPNKALVKAEAAIGRLEALHEEDRFDEAILLAEQTLGQIEPQLGKNHLKLAELLVAWGNACARKGQYEKARPLLERALAIQEAVLPAKHLDLARSLDSLANVLLDLAEYDAARPMLERALAIRTALLDSRHLALAESTHSLCSLALGSGQLDQAIRFCEQSLAIFEKRGEPGSLAERAQLGDVLNSLAHAHKSAGKFDTAIEIYQRSLKVTETITGAKQSVRAVSINNLARIFSMQGKYEKARNHYQQALTMLDDIYGSENIMVATAMANLAEAIYHLGEYQSSVRLAKQSLAIKEKTVGPKHPQMAIGLSNLALAYLTMGDYVSARPLLERARDIIVQAFAPDHIYVATILDNLADLQQEIGDFQGARPLQERALAIYEKALGPEHPEVAISLSNLSKLMSQLGEHRAALPLAERALAIFEKAYGQVNPRVAVALKNLAKLHEALGEHRAARKMYRRVLTMIQKTMVANHSLVGHALVDLAWSDIQLGDLDSAAENCIQGIAILETALGPEHPVTASRNDCAIYLQLARGKGESARRLQARVLSTVEKSVDSLLDDTSERERLGLILSRRRQLDAYLSLFDRPGDAIDSYQAVLRWKGLVQNSMVRQQKRQSEFPDAERSQKTAQLKSLRRRLAMAYLAPARPSSGNLRKEQIQQLTQEKERLQRSLSQEHGLAASHSGLSAIGFTEICKQLGPDEALVDFLSYRHRSMPAEARPGKFVIGKRLLAFVLQGGQGCRPIRVNLGPTEVIDRQVAALRQLAGTGASEHRIQRKARALGQELWDPLAGLLKNRHRVWIAPDGAISGLPFELLVNRKGDYLIESTTIAYLSSGRNLWQRAQESSPKGHGALVVGGVDFDQAQQTPAATKPSTFRAPKDESGLFPFAPLPETETEAQLVAQKLAKAMGKEKIVLLTGKQAEERTVKQSLPGKRLAHIATHGFFAGGKLRSVLSADPAGAEGQIKGIGFNPMVLSGLLLAGANSYHDTMTGSEDGILTAEEVAGLDLSGVELVTLSACDSGLGEMIEGEGLLGLRRAFDQAGAQALIISLWRVPDRQTQALMTDFYARLQSDPKPDLVEALRQSKLWLKKSQAKVHPRAWASFILSIE